MRGFHDSTRQSTRVRILRGNATVAFEMLLRRSLARDGNDKFQTRRGTCLYARWLDVFKACSPKGSSSQRCTIHSKDCVRGIIGLDCCLFHMQVAAIKIQRGFEQYFGPFACVRVELRSTPDLRTGEPSLQAQYLFPKDPLD